MTVEQQQAKVQSSNVINCHKIGLQLTQRMMGNVFRKLGKLENLWNYRYKWHLAQITTWPCSCWHHTSHRSFWGPPLEFLLVYVVSQLLLPVSPNLLKVVILCLCLFYFKFSSAGCHCLKRLVSFLASNRDEKENLHHPFNEFNTGGSVLICLPGQIVRLEAILILDKAYRYR